ncbi:hypothetical protein [Roseateles agri]|uniref:hypothetical protein n=1 Tax=Roseateles agri TaxID=3098619 RepID=UPI002A598ED2|nr:hypothetical protein [Paucibacter sp. R3-3]
MEFFTSSAQAYLSWIFILSLLAKIVSTVIGLRQRAKGIPSAPVWWTSKVSALALGTAAMLLAIQTGNTSTAAAFGVLLVAALAGVVIKARSRRRELARRTSRP